MNVPHFFQSDETNCGPACLRMIFAPLGVTHDEGAIANQCGVTPLGCTAQDLASGARAFGLNAEELQIHGEPDAVAALSNLTPFVAMIDLAALCLGVPLFSWHFVVPLTVANDEVTYHDPAEGPDRRVKLADFLAAWATAGFRGVRVWTP